MEIGFEIGSQWVLAIADFNAWLIAGVATFGIYEIAMWGDKAL